MEKKRNFGLTLDYIRARRTSFNKLDHGLSKAAKRMSRYGTVITVSLIILGTAVSTKAVADKLLGDTNPSNFLIYAVLGALVTVLTGLESAFKWNSKAADLRTLATSCRKSHFAIDVDLRKLSAADAPEDEAAATDVLERVNAELSSIEIEAAKLGVDIPLWVPMGLSVL